MNTEDKDLREWVASCDPQTTAGLAGKRAFYAIRLDMATPSASLKYDVINAVALVNNHYYLTIRVKYESFGRPVTKEYTVMADGSEKPKKFDAQIYSHKVVKATA